MSENNQEPTEIFSENPEIDALVSKTLKVAPGHVVNGSIPERFMPEELRNKITSISMNIYVWGRKNERTDEFRKEYVRAAMKGLETKYLENPEYPEKDRESYKHLIKDLVISSENISWIADEFGWNSEEKNQD